MSKGIEFTSSQIKNKTKQIKQKIKTFFDLTNKILKQKEEIHKQKELIYKHSQKIRELREYFKSAHINNKNKTNRNTELATTIDKLSNSIINKDIEIKRKDKEISILLKQLEDIKTEEYKRGIR